MKPEILTDLAMRPATPADALAIIETRAAAQCGSIGHPRTSQVSPEQIQFLAQQIELGEESFVVAVDRQGEVIGYGSIYSKESNLRALYVKPHSWRRGVGGLILTHLETLARNAGLTKLSVDATIRARTFYSRNGFIAQTRSKRMSTPWYSMACVPMQKTLQPQRRSK
jgi:N-acetylglutamate synthase-like GNAT family acetyltransferase